MHGTTLAVRDTLAAAQQLTNDRLDGTTAHQGETVATVGGDDLVGAVDSVLDTDGNGFLASRQVTETPDLLLLVQAVRGHLHTSAHETRSEETRGKTASRRGAIPDRDHVVVHLLQLILGGLQGVWGRVELVGLEALVGETDGERLVILLEQSNQQHQH